MAAAGDYEVGMRVSILLGKYANKQGTVHKVNEKTCNVLIDGDTKPTGNLGFDKVEIMSPEEWVIVSPESDATSGYDDKGSNTTALPPPSTTNNVASIERISGGEAKDIGVGQNLREKFEKVVNADAPSTTVAWYTNTNSVVALGVIVLVAIVVNPAMTVAVLAAAAAFRALFYQGYDSIEFQCMAAVAAVSVAWQAPLSAAVIVAAAFVWFVGVPGFNRSEETEPKQGAAATVTPPVVGESTCDDDTQTFGAAESAAEERVGDLSDEDSTDCEPSGSSIRTVFNSCGLKCTPTHPSPHKSNGLERQTSEDSKQRAASGAKLPYHEPLVVVSFRGSNMMDRYTGVKPFGVADYIRDANMWTGDSIFIDAEVFGAHGKQVGEHGEPGWQSVYHWALERCKVFLLFASQEWFQSEYCQGEWAKAKELCSASGTSDAVKGGPHMTPIIVLLDDKEVPVDACATSSASKDCVHAAKEAERRATAGGQTMPAAEFWNAEVKGFSKRRETLVFDCSKYHEWTITGKKTLLKDAAKQVKCLRDAILRVTEVGLGDEVEFESERAYFRSEGWKTANRNIDENEQLVRNWVTTYHLGRVSEEGRVDVNSASQDELVGRLPNVGVERAKKIIAGRATGRYGTYSDLFAAMEIGNESGKLADGLLPFVRLG